MPTIEFCRGSVYVVLGGPTLDDDEVEGPMTSEEVEADVRVEADSAGVSVSIPDDLGGLLDAQAILREVFPDVVGEPDFTMQYGHVTVAEIVKVIRAAEKHAARAQN